MRSLFLIFAFLLTFTACGEQEKVPDTPGGKLAYEASKQIGVTVSYNPEYVTLKYPGGDIPKEKGVCTDVVIRALRTQKVDLQKVVDEDMKKAFSKYPKI